MSDATTTVFGLDHERLRELLADTRRWLANHEGPVSEPMSVTEDDVLLAATLFQRWLSVELAMPGGPLEPRRQLPETREELARFFGDIRLANGAGVTGILVEQALLIHQDNPIRK